MYRSEFQRRTRGNNAATHRSFRTVVYVSMDAHRPAIPSKFVQFAGLGSSCYTCILNKKRFKTGTISRLKTQNLLGGFSTRNLKIKHYYARI